MQRVGKQEGASGWGAWWQADRERTESAQGWGQKEGRSGVRGGKGLLVPTPHVSFSGHGRPRLHSRRPLGGPRALGASVAPPSPLPFCLSGHSSQALFFSLPSRSIKKDLASFLHAFSGGSPHIRPPGEHVPLDANRCAEVAMLSGKPPARSSNQKPGASPCPSARQSPSPMTSDSYSSGDLATSFHPPASGLGLVAITSHPDPCGIFLVSTLTLHRSLFNSSSALHPEISLRHKSDLVFPHASVLKAPLQHPLLRRFCTSQVLFQRPATPFHGAPPVGTQSGEASLCPL